MVEAAERRFLFSTKVQIMAKPVHRTALLTVAPDRRILSSIAETEVFLAICPDLLRVDAGGFLSVPDAPLFPDLLAEACRGGARSPAQLRLRSKPEDHSLILHILPYPGVGATIVISVVRNPMTLRNRSLTPREWDVLRLAAKGLRRDRMAFALNISVATVDLHCSNLRRKMGARTTIEAVAKVVAQEAIAVA